MNKIQLKYYRMFIAVQSTLENNNAIWNDNVKFSEAKNQLDKNITSIQGLSDDVMESTKPETNEKNQIRKSLEDKILPISGILNAHAAFSKDESLKTSLISTRSGLETMKETTLVTYSNNLVAKAKNLEHILTTEYSVSTSEIEEISNQTTAFKNLIGIAKPKRAAINAAKQTLNKHVDESNNLLREVIDKLMLRYQITDPQFYNEYQQSRTIVD